MNEFLCFALLSTRVRGGDYAQAVNTTICAIVKSPQSFNGKTVPDHRHSGGRIRSVHREDPGSLEYPLAFGISI